jgi:hypothetical protein
MPSEPDFRPPGACMLPSQPFRVRVGVDGQALKVAAPASGTSKGAGTDSGVQVQKLVRRCRCRCRCRYRCTDAGEDDGADAGAVYVLQVQVRYR